MNQDRVLTIIRSAVAQGEGEAHPGHQEHQYLQPGNLCGRGGRQAPIGQPIQIRG